MSADRPYRRVLDDFTVGQVFKHWPRKTVTESDNNLFCLLTMNHHPLHSDAEYAAEQRHGKIVVAGTYILSLVVGMTVADISGASIANLEYESIIHHEPVFVGDTLSARSKVLDVKVSKAKPDRGVVTIETEAYNQKEQKVLTMRRKILIPKEMSE